MNRLRIVSTLVLAVLTLAAGPALAADHTVDVANFSFSPSNLTINVGDTVFWQRVAGSHTVTNGTGSGDPSVGTLFDATINAGNTSFDFTFNTPGTFPYFCRPHEFANMKGTITVQGGNNAPTVTNPGSQVGVEFVAFSVTIFANDLDGDPLTMTDGGTSPSWATFTDNGNNSATIAGTPLLGDTGTTSVTVIADDLTDTGNTNFNITISATSATVVTVNNFFFDPQEVTVPVGGEVIWSRVAGTHTVTSGTGSGDPEVGNLFDEPISAAAPFFAFTFNDPGFVPYFCRPHEFANMNGSVIVAATTGVGDTPRPVALRAFPNPFSAAVDLAFALEKPGDARVEVFDIRGRLVHSLSQPGLSAGEHRARWDGRESDGGAAAVGMYFARVTTPTGRETVKLFKSR